MTSMTTVIVDRISFQLKKSFVSDFSPDKKILYNWWLRYFPVQSHTSREYWQFISILSQLLTSQVH